jgi:hypothetical protein
MKVRTKDYFHQAGVPFGTGEFPEGEYEAVIAENQPDYYRDKKVFITNKCGTHLLLQKGDYEYILPDYIKPDLAKDWLFGLSTEIDKMIENNESLINGLRLALDTIIEIAIHKLKNHDD